MREGGLGSPLPGKLILDGQIGHFVLNWVFFCKIVEVSMASPYSYR